MQDRAVSEIGKLEFKKNTNLKPFELYTEEPYPNKVCKMLLIEFEKTQDGIHYKGMNQTNVNEKNYIKYGYRKGSSRGGDITFTTKASGDYTKKFNTLINIQFPNLIEKAEKVEPENVGFYESWKKAFIENRDIIDKNINDAFENLDKDGQKTSAYTLVLFENGEKKLLSEFLSIQKLIEDNGLEGSYKKHGVISRGKNNVCSICHQEKPLVFGFGSPFKYSTVDKPGTVSGYHNQKNNWINYPICEDCALNMELGKNYISKKLTRSFFGKRHYLIPKTIIPGDLDSLEDALALFDDLEYKRKKSDQITSAEDFLMEEIGRVNNNAFTLNFLFFEENPTTKAIKIKMMLEEIPPSRFRKLFLETPELINNNPLFKNLDYNFKNKQRQDLRFSFRLIKRFFDDNFYEMTYKIFMGRPIHQKELYKRFMEAIRDNHNRQMNKENYERGELLIGKAILVQAYLKELNLIIN